MYDLVSYRNGGNGFFSKRHGDLHHVGHTLLENGGDEISIVHYQNVIYTNDPTFLNVMTVARLSPNTELSNVGKRALNAPQNEFFYVKDMTVVNYGSGGAITGNNPVSSYISNSFTIMSRYVTQ